MWELGASLTTMPTPGFSCLYHLRKPLAAVVGVTCSLSMIGSFLIVLSYLVIPSIRTRARGILVNLSIMDFLVGSANLVGISLESNNHNTGPYDSDYSSHNVSSDPTHSICIAQAGVAMYATWSSVLWTNCLTVYIYFRVMTDDKMSRRLLYSLYLVAYGLPAILLAWQLYSGRLGFDRHAASSWCSSVVTEDIGEGGVRMLPFNAIFINDIWIFTTIFLVTILLVSLHFHFKREVKGRSVLLQNAEVMVHRVERKLLFIPFFFILLRMWSTLYIIITVEAEHRLSCTTSAFFIFASGIGDSGQGFTNAILFVFATPKVRNYFIRLLFCYSTIPKRLINHGESESTWNSGQKSRYSSFASSESRRDFSDELNGSADKIPKSLLLNN